MKISADFMLREIAGEYVIIPLGKQALSFNAMAATNEVGSLIWRKLQEGCTEQELVAAVLDEYDIDEQTAKKDVSTFVEELKRHNILDD